MGCSQLSTGSPDCTYSSLSHRQVLTVPSRVPLSAENPLRWASVPLASCTSSPLPKTSTAWPEWSPPCPWAHTGLIRIWCVFSLNGGHPLPAILHPRGSSLALLTNEAPAWRCQSCPWVSTVFCFCCCLLGSIHPAASALKACLCQRALSL